MENFEEKTCLCALNRIFGFEPKTALALISHLGSASDVLRMSAEEKDRLLGPHSKHKATIHLKAVEDARSELLALQDKGIRFCGITEDMYPQLLKECPDAPIGLYIRSSTPPQDLWKSNSVAVVGTRNITPYGKEWCPRLVKGLSAAQEPPVIVSGLALGVDIEAHKTALDCGLPTIAVMATGPDEIYPQRHRTFAERMALTPGCALITDYPPGTSPLAIHFLRRNRIIAGLSRATVLIESKLKGGGMMTCRLAFSYDRDVYALPGRIDDMCSQGCNDLIRRKIAEPVTSVSSLAEGLGLSCRRIASKPDIRSLLQSHYRPAHSEEDISMLSSVMNAVSRNRGITVEELGEHLNIGYIRAAELTGLLEIDGFIITDLLQRCSINPKIM